VLQTVRKIGPVLDLFTIECGDWGVAEVASALDIPRSSAHALLASLVETGLLRCRGRGRYRLGWRVVELGETLRGTVDVRSEARPVMRELVGKFGETTNLAVLERGKVVYIDRVIGNQQVNVIGPRVGVQFDPHCTAAGKVLLAYHAAAESDRHLMTCSLHPLTTKTTTESTKLANEFQEIRISGCAFDAGEALTEVHCVAAPIKDDFDSVIAALSVTVPASRFLPRTAELKRAVIGAAGEISARIVQATTPKLVGQRHHLTVRTAV